LGGHPLRPGPGGDGAGDRPDHPPAQNQAGKDCLTAWSASIFTAPHGIPWGFFVYFGGKCADGSMVCSHYMDICKCDKNLFPVNLRFVLAYKSCVCFEKNFDSPGIQDYNMP